MKRYNWPTVTQPAVELVPADHPNIHRALGQIIDHARAGRTAFVQRKFKEARYHRDCCGLFIWRLAVDGLMADGELRWDAAKFETRLPGRLSSQAARAIRESPAFARKKQSALVNHVACDHIVPRNCVAETLIRPGWWHEDDSDSAKDFLLSHGEVAILSPRENQQIDDAGFQSKMPIEWWDAPLQDKATLRLSRYLAMQPPIVVTPYVAP